MAVHDGFSLRFQQYDGAEDRDVSWFGVGNGDMWSDGCSWNGDSIVARNDSANIPGCR